MLGQMFELNMRMALAIVFVAVVVIAPLIGTFAFSPLIVAWNIQPYPLAAAFGVMLAEAITLAALVFLVLRLKRLIARKADR